MNLDERAGSQPIEIGVVFVDRRDVPSSDHGLYTVNNIFITVTDIRNIQ